VTVVQRTSSDLRLNPHLHVVFLDGAYHEDGAALVWDELGHLKTREVGEVLERAVRRMARYLRRHGAIETAEGDGDDVDSEEKLAASAVSGHAPPAGPQWLRGLVPLSPSALRLDKPLCASLDGFTLQAATRAAPASWWRSRVAPPQAPAELAQAAEDAKTPKRPGNYRPWAELLKRTFGVDVFSCPNCKGRMKLIAMVTEPKSVERYLARIGELTHVPGRSPSRGPPYWKSVVLRRNALGDAA